MKIPINRWASGIVLIFLLAILATQYLKIRNISCQLAASNFCPEENQLDDFKNTAIFFLKVQQNPVVSDYARRHNLILKTYQIKLPQTIILFFEKKPLTYTLQLNSGDIYGVSETGTVEIIKNFTNIPSVQADSEVSVFADSQLKLLPNIHEFLLNYTTAFVAEKQQLDRLILKKHYAQLRLKSGIYVLLPYEKSQKKIRQLQQILSSQASFALKEPLQEIDLRFDLPVLRTKR